MLLARIFKRLFARTASGARASWPKLVLVLLVLAALPALAYWRGLGNDPSQVGANASEMVVERVEPTSDQIRANVVLKEKSGPRRLVVTVGPTEAFSIIKDLDLPYNAPSVTAYSLTRQIVGDLGGRVQRVVVNNATDRELFAKVVLTTETRELAVDATPSDAIALALRTKAPIYAEAIVLDRAGVSSR
jgi:uncharacterized protein